MLRDVNCGELRAGDEGKSVSLCGWIRRIRDHGEIIFVDLWDRYGITQIVFNPEDKELQKKIRDTGREWVIQVKGKVRKRPEEMINEEIKTGSIEVEAEDLEVLNHSLIPPFVVKEDIEAERDLKLEYRYLELRRDKAVKRFIIRHKAMQAARKYLNGKDFLEIETPILARSTPEGARDFLVPSRMHPGSFYSLAQSPQLYKQILMVAGFDRYYQFARCLRDEDMRGDRQLEHTQIDIEMSFVQQDDIFKMGEELMAAVLEEAIEYRTQIPFPRIDYREAMDKYGTDKPDLRNPLEIEDYTDVAQGGNFGIFNSSSTVMGISIERSFSRKEIDELEEVVKEAGAMGLLYLTKEEKKFRGPFVKYFEELEKFNVDNGETLFLIAGEKKEILHPLGRLRTELGDKCNLIDEEWKFLWVTGFPIFEWNEDEERWQPMHHIFSQPVDDIEEVEENPDRIKGKLYDLVLNGVELGSGSIRNHDPEVQKKLFKIIGMDEEQIENRFGFFLKSLSYGAPPHGGIALGFDRICMILAGLESISDVIAFPKTLTGTGLMEGSPSEVSPEELRDLYLEIKKNEEKN